MDKYTVVPVSSEDLPTLSSFLYTAKQFLTINRVLWKNWPNEIAQRHLYSNTVESSLKNPSIETFKAVHIESNEMVGHVVVSRCQPITEEQKAARDGNGGIQAPHFQNADVFNAVIGAVKDLDKGVEGIDRFGPYFISLCQLTTSLLTFYTEITHIFVSQAHRNKGIGSQLVKIGIDKAKAAGLPLVVGAEPASHTFFQKAGFEDTEHVDIDLRQWSPEYCGFGLFRLWGMILKN